MNAPEAVNLPTTPEAVALLEELPDTLDHEQARIASRATAALLYHHLPDLPPEFTPRDVYWSRWSWLDSPSQANKGISYLVKRGVLTLCGCSHLMPLYRNTHAVQGAVTTDLVATQRVGGYRRQNSVSVSFLKDRNKWWARGWRDGKRVSLGVYATREEAEAAS